MAGTSKKCEAKSINKCGDASNVAIVVISPGLSIASSSKKSKAPLSLKSVQGALNIVIAFNKDGPLKNTRVRFNLLKVLPGIETPLLEPISNN